MSKQKSQIMYFLQSGEQIKYLDVILDKKLTWNAHLENRNGKALKNFFQCRRIIGNNWGLKPKYALWLFNTIVRPIITYGSLVQNILNKLKRLACLCVTGSFKTTPTKAIEIFLDLRPFHIHIKMEAMSSAYSISML